MGWKKKEAALPPMELPRLPESNILPAVDDSDEGYYIRDLVTSKEEQIFFGNEQQSVADVLVGLANNINRMDNKLDELLKRTT